MIRLTKEEKASRYDALQAAIRLTAETWRARQTESLRKYEAYGAEVSIIGVYNIGAYNKGMADAYEAALETLERWKNE